MTLINSISGIRGTIGGKVNDSLTPIDIVAFAGAYATFIKDNHQNPTIIIGRDGRITGPMVSDLVVNTLRMSGVSVIDAGLCATPTIEMAVQVSDVAGGIIITASHNPMNWNAMKLLNEKGEFLQADEGKALEHMIQAQSYNFCGHDELGTYTMNASFTDSHIKEILALDEVNSDAIRAAKFSVVVDPINSVGSIGIKPLLAALGVDATFINEEISGIFNHNPEPLQKNLTELAAVVQNQKADLGISVDPDVDRLALMSEDGNMFGEEYTLVAVADYLLSINKGDAVSNLSSSRALADICKKHGVNYHASAVGEVNVVNKMKSVNALIGGEGNGGIIMPKLHYGRDALVGIALFLSYLAQERKRASEIRLALPSYFMSKTKATLDNLKQAIPVLNELKNQPFDGKITDIDGIKIDFEHAWVHMRKSNTEPIIRIYTEARTQSEADALGQKYSEIIHTLLEKEKRRT